jgi:hypothetical protein
MQLLNSLVQPPESPQQKDQRQDNLMVFCL